MATDIVGGNVRKRRSYEILTWYTQTPITSADAAADPMSAWVEGAEVH